MSTSSDKRVLICTNFRANPNQPSCGSRNSDAVLAALLTENLDIAIQESPCMGLCDVGPNVRLVPNGACFNTVSPEKLKSLIKEIKSFTAC